MLVKTRGSRVESVLGSGSSPVPRSTPEKQESDGEKSCTLRSAASAAGPKALLRWTVKILFSPYFPPLWSRWVRHRAHLRLHSAARHLIDTGFEIRIEVTTHENSSAKASFQTFAGECNRSARFPFRAGAGRRISRRYCSQLLYGPLASRLPLFAAGGPVQPGRDIFFAMRERAYGGRSGELRHGESKRVRLRFADQGAWAFSLSRTVL